MTPLPHKLPCAPGQPPAESHPSSSSWSRADATTVRDRHLRCSGHPRRDAAAHAQRLRADVSPAGALILPSALPEEVCPGWRAGVHPEVADGTVALSMPTAMRTGWGLTAMLLTNMDKAAEPSQSHKHGALSHEGAAPSVSDGDHPPRPPRQVTVGGRTPRGAGGGGGLRPRTHGVAPPPPSRDGLEGKRPQRGGPAAVRQAVGGGCQSGWGRLLSVTNPIQAGAWRQRDSGWA